MGLFYRWEQRLLHFAGNCCSVPWPFKSFHKHALEANLELKGMARTGLEKTEAEDLLDWLEANGYHNFELAPITDNSFSVSWSN
jgi:hypothetical protein